MAETFTMNEAPSNPEILNSDEQESLEIGEEMAQQQETKLAGKYKNAEELEAAYIELQKKLGSSEETVETETPESESTENEVDTSLFDRLWDESQDQISEDLIEEISKADPTDLANMYLEYRNSTEEGQVITEEDAITLKGFVIDADLRFKIFGVIGPAFLDYPIFNPRPRSVFLDPLLKLTFRVMMRYVFSQPSP